jgi:hypothetical protein
MSAALVLQQYWQLTRTLVFPLRVTRWLMMGTLLLAMLGGILFWWAEHPVVLMISGGIAYTFIILIGIMVPAQMLSLASSKQLFWIPGLRRKTFLILVCVYSLAALLVLLLFALKLNVVSFAASVAVAFTFAAAIAVLMLVSSAYFQCYQPFIFVLVWIVYFIAEQLLMVHALISFALGVLIWSMLYLWWTRWVPQKYFINYMIISPAKLRDIKERQAGVVQSLAVWLSSAPRSLCGTLLSGASDGFKARLKYELGQLAVVLSMVLIFSYFFRDVPKDGFLKMAPFMVLTFIVARSAQIQQLCYRNLHRLWMFYGGSRTNLFHYVEKQYALNIGFAYGALVLVMLIINAQLGGNAVPISFLAFGVAIGVLFTTQLFYLGWVIYQKTNASTIWFGWLTNIIAALFLVLTALLDLFWVPNISHNSQHYGIVLSLMLAVLLVLRYWALNRWNKIDFYRVKT